ncbi:MAG: type II secretion system F family protein [Candidatus Saccharibacteria bacterium]|nr:type II secretion system F family protein [Candidatus Saccharibacteria bacterium]
MKFNYTATNKEGKTITGISESMTKEALIANLTHQGLRPIVVKANTGKNPLINRFNKNKKVKQKELVVFIRQLSTMVGAGVPLTRSLAMLQGQTESKYFKIVLTGITKDVESGIPLADALAKYPNVFSEVFVNMVRAGEAGGILDEILKRLATQVEKDSSMRKKVKSAMTYPVAILTITTIAFFGVMIFVIPKIGKILTDLSDGKSSLPIYTRVMLSGSAFMQHNAILILVVFFGVIYAVRRYIKTAKGKYQFHALLLKTPVVKMIITKVAIARFSRTFASLMSAGVGVLEALDVTGGAIGNKVIEAELKEAAKAVKNGKQLSEPLSESKHFPPIVSQMLAVGEETGQIDTILIKVADFYEEEVEAVVDGLSSIIEPLMIIVLGAVVGLIAASVMGPIANLSKNIGT